MLLLLLAGCAPEPGQADPPAAISGTLAESGYSCCRVPQAQLEITKHVRDGERYERAGMLDQAEREFWFAELKLFGLRDWGMRDLLALVRGTRLRLVAARRR
jgi:hypothetical protein